MNCSYRHLASLSLVGALSVAAVLPGPARATGVAEGTAYRLDDGVAAYREMHLLFEDDGNPARLVLYRCMDGAAFARKIVVDRSGASRPDFDFIDGRTGYREGVRTIGQARQVYWRKSAASSEKAKRLDIPANAVIDAGFDAMVRTQWARLESDEGISANFLLPSALRFLKVRIERMGGTSQPGETRLRMKLDTWYGFAVPETEIDYLTGERRLVRFKGIGSIRDLHGRNQAVRIEFPGGLQGRSASAAEIQAARRLPLATRCGA